MSDPEEARLQRIVDANLNRLREGLRVLEDLNRYFWDDKEISREFKELRHNISRAYSPERLKYRDIENDVLKESSESEMQRSSLSDIVTANFSRAQESSRVLEEIFKLADPRLSALFKEIRYRLYGLEKRIQIEKVL